MNENEITINIPLKSGNRLQLTLEDARHLRDRLNELFAPTLPANPVPIYPVPWYVPPVSIPTTDHTDVPYPPPGSVWCGPVNGWMNPECVQHLENKGIDVTKKF